MRYIIIGIIAFIFFFLFDIYSFKKDGVKKRIFGIIGIVSIIYSSVKVIVISGKIDFQLPVRIVASVLSLVVFFLLIYSLFLELPFVKTYREAEYSSKLMDTGTYALCRHPGVLWFGLLFLFLFLATGSAMVIIAGIIWTSVDIVYIYIQEKLFFHKFFKGYNIYTKSTPMLIPTRSSIRRCISTLY